MAVGPDAPGSSAGGISMNAKTERIAAPQGARSDAIVAGALVLVAFATRLWRLEAPNAIVWDESVIVSAARCLAQHLPYRTTHPPLEAMLVALSIRLFGDQPWSWRLPNAVVGSLLVGITYILAKRMFDSRLAAALAAGFVICDGLFFIDSRTAVWEILYLTSAAAAYLMLFRFAQTFDRREQRTALVWMGLALGLGLGSKLLIPIMVEMLVLGFVIFILVRQAYSEQTNIVFPYAQIVSATALVGGLTAFVYMLILLPNYWLGFWHGIIDQLVYYREEWEFQKVQSALPHPYGSPWWSWPLMLRGLPYWTAKGFSLNSNADVAVIRAISNPIICWGVTVSMPLVGIQAIAGKGWQRSFLIVGYLLYLAMWAVNPRYQFIYHYMPALYLGFLALAILLAECWQGVAPFWQQVALLFPLGPALILGLGPKVGFVSALGIAVTYLALLRHGNEYSGKFVLAAFALAALAAFVYFFPVWTGLPLSAAGFHARMWLHGRGLPNWT